MKDKIVEHSDRLGFWFLCFMVFFAGFSTAGINISIGFLLLAFIIKKVTSCRLQVRSYFPSTRLNLPILFFILASILSIVGSPDLLKSLWALFFKTGRYLILYFLVVDAISTKKRLWAILAVLLVSSALLGVDGIWQRFSGIDFLRQRPVVYEGWLNALTASFKYHTQFGGYLALYLPLVLVLSFSKKIKFSSANIVIGLLAALLLACLGLTYSRGAWVGFLAGLIFIIIYQLISLSTYKRKIIFTLIVLVLLIGIIIILPDTMKGMAVSIVNMQDSGRFIMWKEAMNFIKEKPIFGHGLGVYMDLSKGRYAHNGYLQMAAETGIVGLASFLWILVRLFGAGIRALKERKDMLLLGLLAGILAFLVHSFFDTHFYTVQLSVLLWFTIGLAVSSQRLVNQPSAGVTSLE